MGKFKKWPPNHQPVLELRGLLKSELIMGITLNDAGFFEHLFKRMQNQNYECFLRYPKRQDVLKAKAML